MKTTSNIWKVLTNWILSSINETKDWQKKSTYYMHIKRLCRKRNPIRFGRCHRKSSYEIPRFTCPLCGQTEKQIEGHFSWEFDNVEWNGIRPSWPYYENYKLKNRKPFIKCNHFLTEKQFNYAFWFNFLVIFCRKPSMFSSHTYI